MIVMAKEIRINVRTTEQIKQDLEIAAELKGLTVSALVNSLVVKTIREEKDREPKAFENIPAKPQPKVSKGSAFIHIGEPKSKVAVGSFAKKTVVKTNPDEDMGLQFSGGNRRTGKQKEDELNRQMDEAIAKTKKNKKS